MALGETKTYEQRVSLDDGPLLVEKGIKKMGILY